ncbi:hypothetical protein ABMA27_009196 [Loxostege sticticalis]|uniref:Reverse transcriptase domain-containing protein n=1 Tax=Loxostege sticticalis TaxID=481309 RepID=A0ABR3HA87_LOXSC
MEDYRTATKLMSPNCYMASVDLQDAYFLINMHESSKKYLRFKFEQHTYEFQCLPFGLSSAPYIFTKLLKPVVSYLRSKGFFIVNYLDDFLCLGSSYSDCLNCVTETVNLLTNLGFVINHQKSQLIPSQCQQFLGFELNSLNMTIGLPLEKRKKILNLLKDVAKRKNIIIREFAKLLGVLTSACPAIAYGWMYTKLLEREKFLALRQSNDNYDGKMVIPDILNEELIWWEKHIMTATNLIRNGQYSLEIYSDASLSGWGVMCNGERANGFWDSIESQNHINLLELKAAFMGLQCFASDIHNSEILLRIDNTVAISYINRMGGIQYSHLNEITRQIWKWCEERQLYIFASYIKSKDNVEADEESRRSNIDTEWDLSFTAFTDIVDEYGEPEIDLFASRLNTKCTKYISWKRDPSAFNVDAFTVDWGSYYFYSFPPFSLILKCLRKIINDRATDPFQNDIPFLMEFLTFEYNNGANYSSLNTYRSALALIFGKIFSENDIVIRFLRGVFRSRPSFPRYQTTWDPNIILDFVSNYYPNDDLTLGQITKKLAVLLALSSGQRVQTLSLIRVSNIRIGEVNIEIVINDIIKTSMPGRPMPRLVIPFFPNRVQVCPAKTLSSYLEATQHLRSTSNTERLFLTTRKPVHNASPSTISRWIKEIMKESGIDTEVFSAHSTRHASTSAAHRRGISLDLIKRCAGWSGNSLVFSKFYDRPLTSNCDEGAFAEAIYDSI